MQPPRCCQRWQRLLRLGRRAAGPPTPALLLKLLLLAPALLLSFAAQRSIGAHGAAIATTTAPVPATAVADLVAAEAGAAALANASTAATGLEQESIRVALREWYTSNFKEGEVVLLGLPNNRTAGLSPSDKPCAQLPSVQMRSSALGANGACPSEYANLSCTCITGYIRPGADTVWEFKVRKKAPGLQKLPTKYTAESVLEVDSIATIWAPATLQALRISGNSSEPLPITFISDNRAGAMNDLPIVRSEAKNFSLESVAIYNIDMHPIVLNAANFIPESVTNLTMRNCGLKTYGLRFGQGLANIQYMDFSSNKLTFVLAGNNVTGECLACAMRSLNLTNNEITVIPEYLFTLKSLEQLYLAGNKLDYNVSQAVFDGINKLAVFTADGPAATVACTAGELRSVHDVAFCVTTKGALSIRSAEGKGVSTLVYIVIGCAAAVLALALFVYWQQWHRRSSSKDHSESMFVNTLDFEDSHSTAQARLLNDPLLITNRIAYEDVVVGECISKGGFGLVFVGTYNGRKVAIKKIRPDLSDNMEQIELFLKEIALMAMLVHPRIVEFVGVAWDSLRHLSAVTEFMERGDLRDVLQGFKVRGCRLTWANHKTHIALHIAEALTYLHSLRPKKVIHRDLKSKNVLLNADMEAKLSDFGISRERRFEETHMTAGIGTSFWIAPEVLLGKDYDERADIFSFGVVMSEIDTDDYPYWNDKTPQQGGKLQQAEILRQVAAGELRPTFSDDCPKAILDLADSCLQADPSERPTATEIEYELQRMLRDSWSS